MISFHEQGWISGDSHGALLFLCREVLRQDLDLPIELV